MKSLYVHRERPPLRHWASVVAGLALVSLFVVVDTVRGQEGSEKASDLFGSLQRRLSEAADAQLAAIQAQNQPQGNAVSGSAANSKLSERRDIETWRPNAPTKGAKTRSFEPRFQSMGVEASRIFGEVGVPTEFLAVAQVESNFNPKALSRKGAFGLWQLMPSTARRYGLRVDATRDDRADPEKATRAAARYLRDLHGQFGDWLLALAAYNAGEDLVQKAMERAGTADYWSLSNAFHLPKETRNYVPAVLAAARLAENSGNSFADRQTARARSRGSVLFAVFSVGVAGANTVGELTMQATFVSAAGR